jgi:hypothetical protein
MLSPSARRKLESATGLDRHLMSYWLDRVRSATWRAKKRHTFHGTDLEVFKPGDTSYRLAGWIERNGNTEIVYIAELYSDHDHYERELPGRFRSHYDRREFQRFDPVNVLPLEGIAEAERDGTELIFLANRAIAHAEAARSAAVALAQNHEREHNEALELALKAERERNTAIAAQARVEQELVVARRMQEELRGLLAKLESRSFWRRLLWACWPGGVERG